MVEIEEILRDREARGLRVPAALRVGVVFYLALSIAFGAPTSADVRAAGLPIALVLIVANLVFLRLLSRRQHVRVVGYVGACLDAAVLPAAALLWYWVGGAGVLAPGFLTKAPLTILTLALIAINSLALRATYPLIVTAGGFLTHVAVAVAIATDSRTVWAQGFADLFAGDGVAMIAIVNQIVIVGVVGCGLAHLSRTAQRTIRQTVELELEKVRIQHEQAQLLMDQKLGALAKLVAGISHEVNSPLSALRAGADTEARALRQLRTALESGELAATERPLLALTRSIELGRGAAERIDDTMRSLRRFARLDESPRKRVPLADCIDSALAMLPPELKQRLPSIERLQLPAVECDPAQLNQAFHAVISHACAHTSDGVALASRVDGKQVVVEVGYRCRERQGPELFDVGLSPRDERVAAQFDLPIANSIVVHHGGTLGLRAEGEDKRFVVRLPLA